MRVPGQQMSRVILRAIPARHVWDQRNFGGHLRAETPFWLLFAHFQTELLLLHCQMFK